MQLYPTPTFEEVVIVEYRAIDTNTIHHAYRSWPQRYTLAVVKGIVGEIRSKYKLVTLPRGTAKMPILDLGYSAIVIKQGASLAVSPQTLNYTGGNQVEASGYTFTISDVRLFSTFEGVGINTPQAQALNQTTTLGTSVSKTVVGTTINIRATTINTLFGSNTQLTATLTIEGRDSGARITVPFIITKVS